jgi:hypothetical protein
MRKTEQSKVHPEKIIQDKKNRGVLDRPEDVYGRPSHISDVDEGEDGGKAGPSFGGIKLKRVPFAKKKGGKQAK